MDIFLQSDTLDNGKLLMGLGVLLREGPPNRKTPSTQIYRIVHLLPASDSEQAFMIMSGFAAHVDSQLAIARHEKIDSAKIAKRTDFSNWATLVGASEAPQWHGCQIGPF